MKAIVMAGGLGTRMRPFVAPGINKHLVRVHDRPLLEHVLIHLRDSGVREVLILSNGPNPGQLMEATGNGSRFDMSILHAYRDDDPKKGPAWNLISARSWINEDPCLVILGDSLYTERLPVLRRTEREAGMWVMRFPHDWDDLGKYAQIVSQPDGLVTEIERTKLSTSRIIQTGAWVFPHDVCSVVQHLEEKFRPQNREVRLTDVAALYVREDRMRCSFLKTGTFIDCGTPDGLFRAETILRQYSRHAAE